MKHTVLVTPPGAFAATAATCIADIVRDTIADRGDCSIALCGGRTPEPVYADLVGRAIPWPEVSVYFGDERAVPPDHPDSNYRMAHDALLARVPVLPQRVYRMEAERVDGDAAAVEYQRVLPLELDLLLLGVGPDGHTASLFPGSPALSEGTQRVLAVAAPPPPLQPQLRRLTITPPVIVAAREIIVMVTGGDKAALMARILDGPDCPGELPAQLARRGRWILDDAAAAQLHNRDS